MTRMQTVTPGRWKLFACMLVWIAGGASSTHAQQPPPTTQPTPAKASSSCALQCKDIEKRIALPLEYELCAADLRGSEKSAETAARYKRIESRRKKVRVATLQDAKYAAHAATALCWANQMSQGTPVAVEIVIPEAFPELAASKEAYVGEGVGDFALRCLSGFVPGHYQITSSALGAVTKPADDLKKLIATAATKPDDYLWGTPAAHGQTLTIANSTQPDTNKASLDSFNERIVKYMDAYTTGCSGGDATAAAHALGYLLHAVQDLATHQGMTNPEHSYQSFKLDNPDAEDARLDRAKRWSRCLLRTFARANRAITTCSGPIKDVDDVPWEQLAKSVGSKGYDRTGEEMRKYLDLGPQYALALGNKKFEPTTWFDDNGADAFFIQKVLDVVSKKLGLNDANKCP